MIPNVNELSYPTLASVGCSGFLDPTPWIMADRKEESVHKGFVELAG